MRLKKVKFDIECEKCNCSQRLIYKEDTQFDSVHLNFITHALKAIGWNVKKNICPVCREKMTDEEFLNEYVLKDHEIKVKTTTADKFLKIEKGLL